MEVQSLLNFDLDPGPVDQSILVWQHEHRSAAIWEDEVPPRELTCRHKLLGMRDWPLEPLVCQKLIKFGLYGVYKVAFIQLDYALITALVERWRPETHTFHLPAGEITVTLQDVNILLGLRVDGPAVTGSTKYNWADLCEDLLGQRPGPKDLHGSHVSLAWLRDNFRNLPADPDEVTLNCHTRAFVLALMSGFLYGDKSKHDVALTFLPLLRDFDEVAKLSWGSATLALLYRELCRASKRTVSTICGPLVLLQLWAWERLHVGRPGRLKDVGASYMDGIDGPLPDPLGCRWRASLSHKENPRGGLDFYRDQFDQQKDEQVIWQPYTPDLLAKLPLICLSGQNIWRTVAPLICFDVVEWHRPDRVLRQFGLHQTIPAPCDNEKALHAIDKRGKSEYDWSARHSRHIELWEARESSVVLGEPECSPMDYNDPYMEWYRRITRRIISPMNERRPGQFLPTGFAFQVLVQRVAAIHARSKASLEEELTVDTARQTLQDIVDMCAGALQLNAPLGSLPNGSVAQASTPEPFLMLPQPTATPQKPMSGEMECFPLNDMGIDDGLSAEALEVMRPIQDIGCEQSLPSVSQKPLFWPSGGKLTFSWICDVMLGFDWSSRNLPPCEFSSVLPFNVLDELVLSASKILKKEPNCVRIDSDKAKVVVVGDLHGQLHDLLFLLQDAGFPDSDQFYVFNGNYVDKGAWGLETFLLLLSWKVLLPERVYLLRGSHESESCTSIYGFKNEVLTKYGGDKGAAVYKKCLECFQLLPLASVIAGKVFTAHGGLFRDVSSFLSDKQERSRKRKRTQKKQADNSVLETENRSESMRLGSLKDLSKVKRRVLDPPTEGSNLIPGDILWSDPSKDAGLFLNNERGIGLLWGPDCTAKFLQDNDLKLIIRGKGAPDEREKRDGLAPMNEGYAKDHEGLITLFSAPDHPQFQDTEERRNNRGAYIILQIPECEEPKFQPLEAVSPRPKAEAYYDYRSLIHSPSNLVHNVTNSVDSPFSAPDDKDSLISSENVEYKSMDLSEPMEVDEKDDVDSKCSESRTDEVTGFGTLASSGDKDMIDLSEKTKNGSKEAEHFETAEISKDLSDSVGKLCDSVGKPESCSRTGGTSEATGLDEKLESSTPKAIDLEPQPACDLHVPDSGKSIESRTEKAADIEPMAVDEIVGEFESRIGEENDVEASNITKISEEKAEEGRKSDSLEASNNVISKDKACDAKPRVDDCSTTGDAAAELEITYDEKLDSAVTEISGNETAECTIDRDRDMARDMAPDGAENLEHSTHKLNYSEPGEDVDDSTMMFRHNTSCAADSDLGTVNGGVTKDCTSVIECLTSNSVVAHDRITNITKPSHDKDHGESADKPERVIKLVTYSKRKSSDKKHTVDSSEEGQQKISEPVDSKTKGALDETHEVPRRVDS